MGGNAKRLDVGFASCRKYWMMDQNCLGMCPNQVFHLSVMTFSEYDMYISYLHFDFVDDLILKAFVCFE